MTPDAIKKLSQILSNLPSLGPRQATRLAFYIAGMEKEKTQALIKSLNEVGKVARCRECFILDELTTGLCPICNNPRRTVEVIAIVEKDSDVRTLEKTNAFKGRYLVLGELPKDGVISPAQKTKLKTLIDSISAQPSGRITEIILALSPTTTGDINAGVLSGLLHKYAQKVTRLARGLPTGAEIEFSDEETLESALKNRS